MSQRPELPCPPRAGTRRRYLEGGRSRHSSFRDDPSHPFIRGSRSAQRERSLVNSNTQKASGRRWGKVGVTHIPNPAFGKTWVSHIPREKVGDSHPRSGRSGKSGCLTSRGRRPTRDLGKAAVVGDRATGWNRPSHERHVPTIPPGYRRRHVYTRILDIHGTQTVTCTRS